MIYVKYLILGAGPSGLTLANALQDAGESSFVVLEKESEVGGLCRSSVVDGSPLDIGGGHFLDVKSQKVLDFLFRFLPRSEWCEFDRISRINLKGSTIDYPLEANLWQLPFDRQLDYLESIAQAGCVRKQPMPEAFEEWIHWKLGGRIAEDYMLPYNQKLWSMELSKLGTYWLHKLPDVSFRDTLLSCLQQKSAGSVPAHGKFLYPKEFGYGEVWKRMASSLGERLVTECPVTELDVTKCTVNNYYCADTIISTIPWPEINKVASLPDSICSAIDTLDYVSITVDYVPERVDTDAHWIYEPDERCSYHRILCRHNFLPGSRGHWTETNTRRSNFTSIWRHNNEYAYPVNTLQKPQAIKEICEWGNNNRIIGMGRWGTWEHMNSDVAVASALSMADHLATRRSS